MHRPKSRVTVPPSPPKNKKADQQKREKVVDDFGDFAECETVDSSVKVEASSATEEAEKAAQISSEVGDKYAVFKDDTQVSLFASAFTNKPENVVENTEIAVNDEFADFAEPSGNFDTDEFKPPNEFTTGINSNENFDDFFDQNNVYVTDKGLANTNQTVNVNEEFSDFSEPKHVFSSQNFESNAMQNHESNKQSEEINFNNMEIISSNPTNLVESSNSKDITPGSSEIKSNNHESSSLQKKAHSGLNIINKLVSMDKGSVKSLELKEEDGFANFAEAAAEVGTEEQINFDQANENTPETGTKEEERKQEADIFTSFDQTDVKEKISPPQDADSDDDFCNFAEPSYVDEPAMDEDFQHPGDSALQGFDAFAQPFDDPHEKAASFEQNLMNSFSFGGKKKEKSGHFDLSALDSNGKGSVCFLYGYLLKEIYSFLFFLVSWN